MIYTGDVIKVTKDLAGEMPQSIIGKLFLAKETGFDGELVIDLTTAGINQKVFHLNNGEYEQIKDEQIIKEILYKNLMEG